MAGPLDIQRLPRALVDLLGLKATGDAPHTISDTVIGTVDLSNHYSIDRTANIYTGPVAVAAAQTAYPTPGTSNVFVTPSTEVWSVLHVSAMVNTVAGNTFSAANLGIWRSGAPAGAGVLNSEWLFETQLDMVASSNRLLGRTWRFGDLWMFPGDAFAFMTFALTGGPGNVNLQLRVAKLII